MRTPKYLSPTSLMLWEKKPEEFYLNYLADNRPPKIPQTQPMSVGSAFDAYVKSYLHQILYGESHRDSPQFSLETIFESQVEIQNRDWALEAGKHAFESYRRSGALSDLLLELQQAKTEPKFEFTVEGAPFGVPLLGKPDLHFTNKYHRKVILDWKVNGYCSRYNKSPEKGYVKLRDGWNNTLDTPQSRTNGSQHKDAHIIVIDGVRVNVAHQLEQVNSDWAIQLSTYAWLCGAQVGEQFIVALDQLACAPSTAVCHVNHGTPEYVCVPLPNIRIAEHRLTVSQAFQLGVKERYKNLWDVIKSGHIFRNLSEEESAKRCGMLDLTYQAYAASDGPDYSDLFSRE